MADKQNVPQYITVYGLEKEQYDIVKKALKSLKADYMIRDPDALVEEDLIGFNSTVLIINSEKLSDEGRVMLFEFYKELCGQFDETVVWLGKIPLPTELEKAFKHYESFDDMIDELKYILFNARKRRSKSVEFCKVLTYGIQILSLIRNKPGIKTSEIIEKTELPQRTVQRYIKSLQVAGEHIEYDYKLKGWKLSFGKSILFGDYFNEQK